MHYFSQILNDDKLPSRDIGDSSTLGEIFNLLFMVLGALAVLLFVIAGLRYVVSQGDPSKIAESKMRLVHIGIGLVLASLAVAIVNFVVGRVN